MGTMPWLDGAQDMQLTQTHDAYAQHRGAMPCAREYNNHECNAMAQCFEAADKIGGVWHGQGNNEP